MSGPREPFMAFVSGADDLAAAKAFAQAHRFPENFLFQGGIPEACDFLKQHTPPDVLLVDVPNAAEAQTLLDQLANVVDAHTRVMVVGNINEYSFFTWLTEIGIAHYFLKPLKAEALESTYAKLSSPPPAQATQEKKPGRTVGIIGSKGGVGATSLATLLAALINKHTPANVALIDLNPQDGSIAALLDLEPCRGVHEALEKPDRIDDLLLDRLLVRARDRLYILSAEETLGGEVHAHPDAPATLLNALRRKYDVVLVDVSHHLTPFSKQCLALMDEVVVVTDMTLLGLRGAMRLFDWWEEALKGKSVRLVTNREGLFEKHEVSEADVSKSIKQPIAVSIPNTPAIFMEIASDLKVLEKDDLPALIAVSTLATLLFPEHMVNQTEGESHPQKKTLLSKLKKK